jgi:uncharacterized membrane protein
LPPPAGVPTQQGRSTHNRSRRARLHNLAARETYTTAIMGDLSRRFRHIDWAMVILVMLLGIVVVVPTIVAVWRYLS